MITIQFLFYWISVTWIQSARGETASLLAARASKIIRVREKTHGESTTKGERSWAAEIPADRSQAEAESATISTPSAASQVQHCASHWQQPRPWRNGWVKATVLETSRLSPANWFSCGRPTESHNIHTGFQRTRTKSCLCQNTGKEEGNKGTVHIILYCNYNMRDFGMELYHNNMITITLLTLFWLQFTKIQA